MDRSAVECGVLLKHAVIQGWGAVVGRVHRASVIGSGVFLKYAVVQVWVACEAGHPATVGGGVLLYLHLAHLATITEWTARRDTLDSQHAGRFSSLKECV